MFTVYHSNCSELFTKLVINIMSNYRLSNPMQSEIIITEHKIMEQWLEIKLSNYFDISANIKFMNMQAFINKISTELLPYNSMINEFSYDSMYWKFMDILPKASLYEHCAIIKQYLSVDINQYKCNQLADQVTNLFLEYLKYRPDWLKDWQSNKIIDTLNIKDQMWQSEIWRMLLKYSQHTPHNTNSINRCIFFLQNYAQNLNYNNFPNRIFIYGIISIPPIYWKILKLLSHHCDIYLWYINPCIKNWNHNHDKKKLHSTQYKFHNSKLNIMPEFIQHDHVINNYCCNNVNNVPLNNFLLHIWGQVGQDTLCLLDQLKDVFEIKSFIIPIADSVLHILQKDVLEFPDCTLSLKNNKKIILNSLDQSITIHACYNVQREIEVLHNNLLLMFSDDPLLLPSEVVVVAPDISCYISSIKNVFNNIFKRQLPFVILNDYTEQINPIVSSVLDILNIPYSRFTSEEILSFLLIPSIALKFNINNEDISLIQKWIIESGIRWGLNQQTMQNFDLPISDRNTWYFGLKRMVLGYSMKNESGIWNDISPYNYDNEEYINIISQLGEFLKILEKWTDRLSCSYSLKEWMPCIQDIINDFFDLDNLSTEENEALFLLKGYWIDILESGIQIEYENIISIKILRDKLKSKLNRKKMNYQFSPNVISFCDFKSICCIPCKILCCIGMNNDVIPSHVKSEYSFNLMFQELRCGDNNIRERDRYLFLLACLLPTERIYISFIEQSIYYNNSIMSCASILIHELLEYIAHNFYLITDPDLDLIKNIECIRKHLLKRYSYTPYDINNFIFNSQTPSFANEWLYLARTNINSNISIGSNFVTSLPPINITEILFNDLYDFYQHPVRTWFQKRLGVYLYQSRQQMINNEPFSVDYLYRFKLNMKLISYLLCNKNTNELYYEHYASGKLPYGEFGKLYWIKQYDQMNKLASQIKEYYSSESNNINISLIFNKIKLTGQLHLVQKHGLVRWKSTNLSMKDCFLFWLEHLVYCAMGGIGDSRLFGIKSVWHFPNFSQSWAQELLSSLILGYCKGMNMPLILLYQSGGVWINHVFDWKNKKIICSTDLRYKKARQKLVQTWQGNNQDISFMKENHDLYLRKIIPFYLCEEDIQRIINISTNYFLDIMKYRIL